MIKKIGLFLMMVAEAYVPGYCEITTVSPEKLSELLSQKPAATVVDVLTNS